MGERVSNCHMGYQKWACEDLVASSDQAIIGTNQLVCTRNSLKNAQKVSVINLMCICFDGVSSERRNYEASPTNWLFAVTEFHIIVSSLNKSLNSPFFPKSLTWWLASCLSPWLCNYSTWGSRFNYKGKCRNLDISIYFVSDVSKVLLPFSHLHPFQPFIPYKKSKACYTSLYHADVLKCHQSVPSWCTNKPGYLSRRV